MLTPTAPDFGFDAIVRACQCRQTVNGFARAGHIGVMTTFLVKLQMNTGFPLIDNEELLSRLHRELIDGYTRAKEVMFERTHIPEAPWWVVQAVDKKRARLNCIHHLLGQFPYEEIQRPPVELPEREHSEEYQRNPLSPEMLIPEIY